MKKLLIDFEDKYIYEIHIQCIPTAVYCLLVSHVSAVSVRIYSTLRFFLRALKISIAVAEEKLLLWNKNKTGPYLVYKHNSQSISIYPLLVGPRRPPTAPVCETYASIFNESSCFTF